MTRRKKEAKEHFLQYASRYDLTDPKIRLKADHTLRVADLCERIADSLDVSREDACLAYLIGILHDIGRFEQVRIYHTFRDALSVNHAQFGADLLFREHLIRDYPVDEMDYPIVETAIRLHNAYRLPDTLNAREKMLCQILRDADKIDILRVNRETPMEEIYDLPREAFLTSEISDKVFEDLMACRDVDRSNSRTGIDSLMGHIAFVFGLVYPESFRIVQEQGFLEQMLSFKSLNGKTESRMDLVRKKVRQYMDSHTPSERKTVC